MNNNQNIDVNNFVNLIVDEKAILPTSIIDLIIFVANEEASPSTCINFVESHFLLHRFYSFNTAKRKIPKESNCLSLFV